MKSIAEETSIYSTSESKVKDVYNQYQQFREDHKEDNVSSITLDVGTNQPPRDDPKDVAKNIGNR